MTQLNKIYEMNDKIAELSDGELNNVAGGMENTSGNVIQGHYFGAEIYIRYVPKDGGAPGPWTKVTEQEFAELQGKDPGAYVIQYIFVTDDRIFPGNL